MTIVLQQYRYRNRNLLRAASAVMSIALVWPGSAAFADSQTHSPAFVVPSRPEEFHPEPLTEPYVILSHHTARATARRLPPSAERRAPSGEASWPKFNGDDPPPSLQPHYRTFITTTRQSAPLRRIGTFGLAVVTACAFSLGIAGQVLTFRTRA